MVLPQNGDTLGGPLLPPPFSDATGGQFCCKNAANRPIGAWKTNFQIELIKQKLKGFITKTKGQKEMKVFRNTESLINKFV